MGVIDPQKYAVSRVIGHRFGRFRNQTEPAVADRRRSCSPRGTHALSKSPRRASELQMKANVSPLARALAISPRPLLPPREHGDRNVEAALSQIHLNRAPWSDSSQPQHHHELLHVLDPTVIPFSTQVELTVSAAPPGRHDRCRPSSHVAVLLEPLTVPSLPCACCCV